MKKTQTRRALLMSALSLLLCCSMLVGTTFAWFTDTVESGKNQIIAGNLDVELEYAKVSNGQLSGWTSVESKEDIFDPNALWEPGRVEVIYLKISNLGTLALKYQLGVNVYNETPGISVETNEAFKLSDYLYFKVANVEQEDGKFITYSDRQAAQLAVEKDNERGLKDYNGNTTTLEVKGTDYVALIVYMPETIGNEANYRGTAIPTIELGVNLFATQVEAESDSFGNDYDKDSAVDTIEKAEALMAQNKPVTLAGCKDPKGILVVPAEYTSTLTLAYSTIKSVQAQKDANIVIVGDVVVNATGVGSALMSRSAKPFDGSAISAQGVLNISGTGHLTAVAADVDHASGIGGMNATEINIKDITIDYVSGSYADYVADTDNDKYLKNPPQGGAAIGSSVDGASIILENVHIVKAVGGSKAAGIGARYWNGAKITIRDSKIDYVQGGASAAGIGGSRVSSNATESGTVINISNSIINAQGGAYGAGIGSGYDTHCQKNQPLCTINIADSNITAKGGKYAAGIGTGYHNAALAGEIKDSAVNAASGYNFYKDTYTVAQDIGFGVVDPAREGQQTGSYLIYNGVKIRCNSESVATLDDLKTTLESGKTAVLENSLTANTNTIQLNGGVLDGDGNELDVVVKGSTEPAIAVMGGTVANLQVNNTGSGTLGLALGTNPYGSDKLTSDLILDNVSVCYAESIFDRSVMYALYAEAVNQPEVRINNSALYGAVDCPGISSFTAEKTIFGSGSYWYFAISCDTSFTNCSFESTYCMIAYDFAAGSTVTFNNCTVEGKALTAENFKSLLVNNAWDYTSEMSSVNLKDCTIVIDGVTVTW